MRAAVVAMKDRRSGFASRPISRLYSSDSIQGDGLGRRELVRFEAAKLDWAFEVVSLFGSAGISMSQKPLLGYPKSSF